MKREVEKSLKRFLKRNIKVTLGMIITFLITGTISYSDISISYDEENGKVIIDKPIGEINQDEQGNWFWTNDEKITEQVNITDISENVNFNIINNGVIKSTIIDGEFYLGNGIYINSKDISTTINTILNFGIIKGISSNSSSYSGNGIYSYGKVKLLKNVGLIEGNINNSGNNSGNGIYIDYIKNKSEIDELENNGIIKGISAESGNGSGNGIYLDNGANIKILKNNTLIEGSSNNSSNDSGNGIFAYNTLKEINILENNGIIRGNNHNGSNNSGNGIYLYNSSNVNELINMGLIEGNSNVGTSNSGNGIMSGEKDNIIGNLSNKGIISGIENSGESNRYSGNGINIQSSNVNDLENSGVIKGESDYSILNLGNGIYLSNGTIKNLVNNGVIVGNSSGGASGNGIYFSNNSIENLVNIGIIAGSNQAIYKREEHNWDKNLGILIDGNGTSDMKVTASTGGEISEGEYKGYIVKNTLSGEELSTGFDNSLKSSELNINEKLIINGVNKAFEYDSLDDYILSDSIVNSVGNSISFSESSKGILTLDNVIVNNSGNQSVIIGSNKEDSLNLKNNSIINGNVTLEDGNDILSLDDTIQINGDLNGGDGKDILDFIQSSNTQNLLNENILENSLNIFHNISGFENIDIGSNVTFFESSKVTGAENINIDKNGNLILRIDGENGNSHALSENKGIIHSDGGKILIVLNGVGEGEHIEFGDTILDETIKGNEIGYSEDITIDTTSLLHNIKKEDENTVIVETVEDLPDTGIPDNLNYEKLNKIYQSIRSTDQVKYFDITDDKKLTEFVKYLHDIYSGSPYAFSSELSRKSMDMFKSSILSKDLKPELNKWAIYGGLTHIDGGTKDEYYGKGYYTYDVGSRDISADTKITGAYMQAEYGKSESLTTGIVFGGNNSETEIGASKVEGDSFYFGAYAKKYLNDFRFTLGAGFQHGDYKADRTAVGYEGITTTRDFSENYHDRGFNIYGDVKYSKEITENLFIEPYFTLGYSYVDQDGVSEDGILSIETDSKNFDYTTGKVGVDIKKVIPMEKGKHILTAGISYENIIDGDDEEYITGRFKGGSDFDILVPEKNSDIFSLNAKYEFEFENGIMFDIKGIYTFENDNMEDEWIAGVGVGYRF